MYCLIDCQRPKPSCFIGNKFCGAVAYTDDLTLDSLSVRGLQSLINECELFEDEYDLVFIDKIYVENC